MHAEHLFTAGVLAHTCSLQQLCFHQLYQDLGLKQLEPAAAVVMQRKNSHLSRSAAFISRCFCSRLSVFQAISHLY